MKLIFGMVLLFYCVFFFRCLLPYFSSVSFFGADILNKISVGDIKERKTAKSDGDKRVVL
jgi:hypothetical protein